MFMCVWVCVDGGVCVCVCVVCICVCVFPVVQLPTAHVDGRLCRLEHYDKQKYRKGNL